MPIAYILVIWLCFLYSFVVVSIELAKNASGSSSMNTDDKKFSLIVFSGWDFRITNQETANNKKAALAIALREAIVEQKSKEKVKAGVLLTISRIVANIIIFGLLAGAAYRVFKLDQF